jgi:hypothetical protein
MNLFLQEHKNTELTGMRRSRRSRTELWDRLAAETAVRPKARVNEQNGN